MNKVDQLREIFNPSEMKELLDKRFDPDAEKPQGGKLIWEYENFLIAYVENFLAQIQEVEFDSTFNHELREFFINIQNFYSRIPLRANGNFLKYIFSPNTRGNLFDFLKNSIKTLSEKDFYKTAINPDGCNFVEDQPVEDQAWSFSFFDLKKAKKLFSGIDKNNLTSLTLSMIKIDGHYLFDSTKPNCKSHAKDVDHENSCYKPLSSLLKILTEFNNLSSLDLSSNKIGSIRGYDKDQAINCCLQIRMLIQTVISIENLKRLILKNNWLIDYDFWQLINCTDDTEGTNIFEVLDNLEYIDLSLNFLRIENFSQNKIDIIQRISEIKIKRAIEIDVSGNYTVEYDENGDFKSNLNNFREFDVFKTEPINVESIMNPYFVINKDNWLAITAYQIFDLHASNFIERMIEETGEMSLTQYHFGQAEGDVHCCDKGSEVKIKFREPVKFALTRNQTKKFSSWYYTDKAEAEKLHDRYVNEKNNGDPQINLHLINFNCFTHSKNMFFSIEHRKKKTPDIPTSSLREKSPVYIRRLFSN